MMRSLMPDMGRKALPNASSLKMMHTQAELARRTQTTKSYISRIENGVIIPSVAVFYRMIAALGMTVEIVKPPICGYGFSPQAKYLSEPEQAPYGIKK